MPCEQRKPPSRVLPPNSLTLKIGKTVKGILFKVTEFAVACYTNDGPMKTSVKAFAIFVYITAAIKSLPFPPPFGKCISFYGATDFVPLCSIFSKECTLHELLPKT